MLFAFIYKYFVGQESALEHGYGVSAAARRLLHKSVARLVQVLAELVVLGRSQVALTACGREYDAGLGVHFGHLFLAAVVGKW